MRKTIYTLLLAAGTAVLFPACETDFDNPNAPSVDQVSNTTNGLYALINGLQYQYTAGGASSLYTSISGAGFSAGELTLLNAGNAEFAALLNGGSSLTAGNSVVTNLWTNLNLVRHNAQTVIDQSGNAATPELQNAIKAYGLLFKGMAIGTMAQFWENAIVESGKNQAFVSRNEALQLAVASLEEASSLISTSGIPSSLSTAVGSHIDMANAPKALAARYNLMLGNYAAAISAAASVDQTKTSRFVFDNVTQNPVFRSSLITKNVYDVQADFGLSGDLAPDPADGRIAFYLTANAENGKGFFTSDAARIPLYLPGEMDLIIAEAQARQNNLGEAITALNRVLTKTAAQDALGVGANLPAYAGAQDQASVLQEIYKNRCIELYMSGMKLEDSRRFGRPGPTENNPERNRNFYPYPNTERDNNTSTPSDPAI